MMVLWTADRYRLVRRGPTFWLEDDEYAEMITPEELVELAAVIRRELGAE